MKSYLMDEVWSFKNETAAFQNKNSINNIKKNTLEDEM